MAKLTAAARRALPKKVYAGKGDTFPIQDKGHAKAALADERFAPAAERPGITRAAMSMLHKR